MKIKPEHVEHIRQSLDYSRIPSLDEYIKVGMSAKRWRWDLLWEAKISNWIGQNIYPYADDSHIDTALRHITETK